MLLGVLQKNLHGIAYLTVWVAPRWRRTHGLLSFGSVATVEVLQFAFQSYPLRKVYQYIVVDNQESLSPASKVFQCEGRLSEHYFFAGAYHDVAILSVTRADWTRIHARYGKHLNRLASASVS